MPSQLRPLRLLALSAGALLTACSTIVSGTGQQVAIRTPGLTDATCHLTGGDDVDMTVSPPATVHVPKSRNNIKIACQTPNNRTATAILKSTYSNFSIVEYPLGYPIDAITGAMWVYPKTLDVTVANRAQPG
jgi:hypothetical protein